MTACHLEAPWICEPDEGGWVDARACADRRCPVVTGAREDGMWWWRAYECRYWAKPNAGANSDQPSFFRPSDRRSSWELSNPLRQLLSLLYGEKHRWTSTHLGARDELFFISRSQRSHRQPSVCFNRNSTHTEWFRRDTESGAIHRCRSDRKFPLWSVIHTPIQPNLTGSPYK